MTRAPRKTAGTRSRRKPVTIDLKPGAASAENTKKTKAAPDAEPVAMNARPAGQKREETQKKETSGPGPATSNKSAAQTATASSLPRTDQLPGGSGLLSGLAGGILALVVAGFLQWVGLVPNLGETSVDFGPVQERIDALQSQIEAVEAQAPPDQSELVGGLANRIDGIETAVDVTAGAVDQFAVRVDDLAASMAQLNAAVEAGEAGDGAAVEALTGRIADVDARIGALADDMAGLAADNGPQFDPGPVQGRIESLELQVREIAAQVADTVQSADELRSETGSAIQAIQGTLEALEVQLGSLSEQVAAGGADSTAVARAFAASSLKNAVDRGGAFASELEAFATIAEENDAQAVDSLRDFAPNGVPTLSQLVAIYPDAANAIIASERALNADAGLAERLVNNMQGLISVRPVNEQAGSTATAISTRIGARLNEGDLAAALAEWEALPDTAKEASAEFVGQLRARQSVDQLLSDILASAMSGAVTPAQ